MPHHAAYEPMPGTEWSFQSQEKLVVFANNSFKDIIE